LEKIFEIIDLFCGGGGTTEGFKRALVDERSIARVIACINHDSFAIQSHAENHPDCIHFTEDIRKFNVDNLPKINPDNYSVLWASLECTNFSKAKGGKPRDADSRTLANDLIRYIKHIEPDYIMIENVREFMAWGDVDENGKPLKMDKGKKYLGWVNRIKKMGYEYDYRLLNCADFGAYQSRERYFGMFVKEGFPMAFPLPTHSKKGGDLFGTEKWKPVKEVLDLDDWGRSIFGRTNKKGDRKDLSENTLKRIYEGLKKFATREEFVIKYNSTYKTKDGLKYPNTVKDINEPCSTLSTQTRLGKVFLSKYYSGMPQHKNISVEGPAGTVKTKDNHAFVGCEFLSQRYSGEKRNLSTGRPTGSITTTDHHHLVSPEYLVSFNYKDKPMSTDKPAPTILTKDRLAKIVPVQFIDLQFSSGTRNQSVEKPAQGLTTVPKHKLMTAQYIFDKQYNNKAKNLEEPSRTIIATQGKKPMYFITPIAAVDENNNAVILIYEDDTPTTKLIKEFMAENGIIDIMMRMLNVNELKRIMGIGDDYILRGTVEKQKWMIGNMVHPIIPEKWAVALWHTLKDWEYSKAA
jgi:DNA (cytosine-5)-methyltransferase 1